MGWKSLDEEFIIRTVSRCGDYDVSVKNAYIITHGGKTVDDVITEELLYKQTIDCNTGFLHNKNFTIIILFTSIVFFVLLLLLTLRRFNTFKYFVLNPARSS